MGSSEKSNIGPVDPQKLWDLFVMLASAVQNEGFVLKQRPNGKDNGSSG